MAFAGTLLVSAAAFVLIVGLALRRALVVWWAAAAATIGLSLVWTWAVLTDHDNLDYGVRLERLVLPALLVLASLGTATWHTFRHRRASSLRGEAR